MEHRNSHRLFERALPSSHLALTTSLPEHVITKGQEFMLSDTFLNLPIETVDCGALAPTYPYGGDGPGYLYCLWCGHYIRLVCHTTAGVKCADCGQAVAMAAH